MSKRDRRNRDDRIGERVIDFIIDSGLIVAAKGGKHGLVLTFSANAAEQLGHFVREIMGDIVRTEVEE